MRELITSLIPQAPHMGLFVAPQIPADRLRNALGDFAKGMAAEDVLALYDGTLMGSGKDGAVFTSEGFVFQNNTLEPVHEVAYRDVVHVETKRRLLGGRSVQVDVNRGRATITLTIDFSGRPEAAEYVSRFLHEAMLAGAALEMDRPAAGTTTDVAAVRRALDELRRRGLLAGADFDALIAVLEQRAGA